jgi:hypothetical protein
MAERAMLGPIAAVTISSSDVGRAIESYGRFLDYRLVQRGPVSPEQAASWGCAALAGRDSALLAPAGRADFRLRFVESRAALPYDPFRHFGWNAAEFLVEDVDGLAQRLADSPFRILGPPKELSFSSQIRAMQVVGPDREVAYLTQIDGKIAGLEMPELTAAVDRVFIVIVGGRSVESLQEFYTTRLSVPRAPIIEGVISVMSRAYDLPPAHLHRLAALPLAEGCYIEADAMPGAAQPRPVSRDELPPAIAMVTFRCRSLPLDTLETLSAPVVLSDDLYRGGHSAMCRGSAGELIELIEDRR